MNEKSLQTTFLERFTNEEWTKVNPIQRSKIWCQGLEPMFIVTFQWREMYPSLLKAKKGLLMSTQYTDLAELRVLFFAPL